VRGGSSLTRAERRAARQAAQAAELTQRLESLLPLRGDERVLDVGCGTGALAYAVADMAREVVAVDSDPSMVQAARAHAPANVRVELADGERLPFGDGDFDVAATLRTLHHTKRPELLLAELVRVTTGGGTILVADQLAPPDADLAAALNVFERARDGSTSRVLAERDLRALLEQLGLTVVHAEVVREARDLDAYLDLAGCEGAERAQVAQLAPDGYEATLGWFVLLRP
jgi:ubiquinone/menaquinone biosynthesis C-methylase UbiE